MFDILGVFAEFERAMIGDRVKSGLARAKANGKKLRPKPVDQALGEKAAKLKAEGLSVRAIAGQLGCL